jgi:hypothetical protein
VRNFIRTLSYFLAISQPDPGEFEALIQQAKTAGLNAKIFSLPLQKQGDMVSFI